MTTRDEPTDMTAAPAKPRSDAWDAALSEAQRWQAFDLFRRAPWYQVAKWAADEFGLPAAPSRAAIYRWARRMREMESGHRIEQSIQARSEIGALAGTAAADAALIDAYKSLAADLALKGDAATAVRYTAMAMAIGEAQRKAAETDLKARAQATKDAALKLAREKFEAAEQRIAAVRDAVGKARAEGGITPETLKKIEEAAGLL